MDLDCMDLGEKFMWRVVASVGWMCDRFANVLDRGKASESIELMADYPYEL